MSEPATQKYFLAQHIHLCEIDDGAIILDLPKNKYMAVDRNDLLALERFVEGVRPRRQSIENNDIAQSPEILDALLERGILTKSRAEGFWVEPVIPLAAQAISTGRRRTWPLAIRSSHIVSFVQSYVYVSFMLRTERLCQMVSHLRAMKNARSTNAGLTASPATIIRHCAIFRRIRTFVYTAHEECLFDALVLAMFLYRSRLIPTFIIGVKTKPFLAHAWVQIGDWVIDERVEKVQMLKPILVV
ncbi:MAG TPA: lasso peptide biosynthesis B2 protein [Steroidobacteraceae bacterium]|jgi:hypothetical protein|nr:lasso peptide biosynthesis B2 protein [Steroidobacteraceae bacterium]